MSKHFLVYYSPGPAWKADKPFTEQDLYDHGAYMKQLYDNDQLMHGGPFLDNRGGVSIFIADSLDEAQDLLDADPAIVSGVFTAELHPWYAVDWDTYG